MDGEIEGVAIANGGFFTRADALRCGWSDRELGAARRGGEIERLRHGAYGFVADTRELDEIGRHLLLARAVVRQQRGRVALTGATAAAVHGIALWDQDLTIVHVVRLDGGSSRREPGVRHHVVADAIEEQVQVVEGLPVVSLARAVWETASCSGLESGVCSVDSALHQHPGIVDDLRRQSDQFQHRPGSRTARMIMRLADGRAESPGESLSRVLFYRNGVPCPDLQFDVRRGDGSLIGTSDFYWEEQRLLGEFDGKAKYGRLVRPGDQPGEVVFREKRREDEMRGESYGMTRWIWADLMPPGRRAFLQRLRSDLDRSGALFGARRSVIA